jgi:beta-glucosidase/6-phospho-beta-glucosidase/beta-galactosidase
MITAGIKPVVTLFHWDTPLALFNSYGAWTDSRIIDDFVAYAKFVITRYDEYVPIWYTFNEPQYCNWQYSTYPAGSSKGLYPAYNNITGGIKARIACSHNTILAHAAVAKWYHNEFHGRGRITMKNSGNYYEARDPSLPSDVDAAARQFEFALGWFAGCWRDGDYSSMLKATLGSLLPVLTQEQKDLIKGSCDFYAIDPYTGFLATTISGGSAACAANASAPGYPECAGSSSTAADGFPLGPAGDNGVNWLWSTPSGIRKFLNTITKDLFPAVGDVVVSEFGFAEPFEGDQTNMQTILWDSRRADYYQSYLDNILAAKVVDGTFLSPSIPSSSFPSFFLQEADIPQGVNVTGAFGWAIFDNFEWFSGNKVKFGMQYLDQKTLKRYPKASMFQFLDWFKVHGGAVLAGGSAGGNVSAVPS